MHCDCRYQMMSTRLCLHKCHRQHKDSQPMSLRSSKESTSSSGAPSPSELMFLEDADTCARCHHAGGTGMKRANWKTPKAVTWGQPLPVEGRAGARAPGQSEQVEPRQKALQVAQWGLEGGQAEWTVP